MKKILLIGILLISAFFAQAQNVRGYKIRANMYLISDSLLVIGTDTISGTTKIDGNDTTLATKQYVLNTIGAGNGWDSLTWSLDQEYLVWMYGGSRLDSISRDGRYVELADSTSQFLTPDSIYNLINQSGMQTVYEITLPVNGTLSGSAAAATDIPAGWILSVSGGDLQINHGLGRYSSAVNIRCNTSGSSYRQLRNFDNAYSGVVDVDSNNLTIESISNFYTAYKLRITIIFE